MKRKKGGKGRERKGEGRKVERKKKESLIFSRRGEGKERRGGRVEREKLVRPIPLRPTISSLFPRKEEKEGRGLHSLCRLYKFPKGRGGGGKGGGSRRKQEVTVWCNLCSTG